MAGYANYRTGPGIILEESQRKRRAALLRTARKIHRFTGAALFVFFFLVAVSGLLLGWKKHSDGLILAKSYSGKSTDTRDWLPIHQLQENAIRAAREQIDPNMSVVIDRIDIRPDKGMVKFVFAEGYWGVQIDCTSGELLHVERRRSDLIENIHDGTIVDYLLGMTSGQFKLVYTSVMGTALLIFTITGFWLWHGPKKFRNRTGKSSKK